METFVRRDLSTRNILLSAVGCLAVYAVFLFLRWYTVNEHVFRRLKNYKKPPQIPILGNALNFIGTPTQIHNNLVDLCFKYGPNFLVKLLNIAIVVVGKPEDLEKVLTSHSCLEKSDLYDFTHPMVGTGLFTAPVEKWRRNRKLMYPTFNSKVLESYLPVFQDSSRILVDEILPKYLGKQKIHWYKVFLLQNLDATLQTIMGVNYDVQRNPIEFTHWMEQAMKAVFIRMATFLYHPDFIFYRSKLGKSLLQQRHEVYKLTDQIIAEKKQKFEDDLKNNRLQSFLDEGSKVPLNRKAFLDCLLELDHRGTKFSQQDLRDEIITFFSGGTDTSTITTCFFLTMMGMYPEIQEKVYEEVKEVIDLDKVPTIQELNKLSYMDRCLKETMRIFSPAPFIFRKISEDLQLSDGVIPKGASIGISPYYMHRNELYWKDPLKFDPDRFLPEEVAKRHPYTFMPFSAGLRGCIGQRYAYLSMKNALSFVLTKYKVHCDAYKSIDEIELKSMIVLRPKDGFKFWLEKREAAS